MAKTSIVLTVFNEEVSIARLLNSISKQTHRPDEVVICDAGSTDQTVPIIRAWAKQSGHNLNLMIEPGNISHGRNAAIKAAKHELIAVTDGGCALDRHWLGLITKPLQSEGGYMVVYGGTQAKGQSLIGRMFAAFYFSKTHGSDHKNTDHSSRSVAFLKSVWEQVGGYPEWLTLAGEDTLFFIKMDEIAKSTVVREAFVYWYHGAENLKRMFKVHKRNSIGAGEAGMWPLPHWALIGIYIMGPLSFFAALMMGLSYLALAVLLFFYMFWSRQTGPVLGATRDLRALYVMPAIMCVRDIGMATGFFVGFSKKPGAHK